MLECRGYSPRHVLSFTKALTSLPREGGREGGRDEGGGREGGREEGGREGGREERECQLRLKMLH